MEFVQLRSVMEIYSTGSVSRASMRLNKPQSFVSRHLSAFEKECGGQIFRRNGRGVDLTELGKRVLPQVESILGAMEDLVGSGEYPEHHLRGVVRVFVSEIINRDFAAKLFAKVRDEFPFARLQFTERVSFEIDAALESGDADVGVLLRNGRALSAKDEPICQFDTYLVGPAKDPVFSHSEILFRDLEGLPLLMPSSPSLTRLTICDLAASRGIPLTIAAETSSPGCTQALLDSGAGYLIAPVGRGSASETGHLGQRIRQGELKAARICDPDLERTLVVAANGSEGDLNQMIGKAAIDVMKAMTLGSCSREDLGKVMPIARVA